MMKRAAILSVLIFIAMSAFSQKVDSIYFHLYTDSLKKGWNNYINVDGKLSNGNWLPLSSKEIIFSSDFGKFEGNDLIVPKDFKEEKVKVKAVLRSNPAISKEIVIWIKKIPDPDKLPTKEEILNPDKKSKKNE